jgi:glycosidase
MKAQDKPEKFYPVFEFHMARRLRREFQLEDSFFSTNGNIIFTDFNAVRVFVHKLNTTRDPRNKVYPGEVNALGLLEEIFHFVLREYEKQVNPKVFSKAVKHLQKIFGEKKLHEIFYDFQDKFPASDIYKGRISISKYLEKETRERPNRQITLEECMMLFFANFNPGTHKLKELFDDRYLAEPEGFRLMIDELEDFFEIQPGFGPDGQDIFSFFKTPILGFPDDISKQLDHILEKWDWLLPEKFLTLLLRGKDLLKEDVLFEQRDSDGDIPTLAPRYKGMDGDTAGLTIGKSGYRYAEDMQKEYDEEEQFTPDIHWMPSVVLLAKNTYVWLDQLSRKYQKDIRRLDQIPNEELDQLRKWNYTGLWLIGIWERSDASRQIKHIMGNIDAVSSAYSLYDYEIAHDLGGEQAYNDLNERAQKYGIRLASDMVPNHSGIYSKWVIEKPDYFIQAPFPPFPAYRFTGENLSQHPDLEIRIEDGYFSRTDAAVVFQRIDKRNNEIRYIYHGNDGTVMPWNDTAQLDMLKKEVREAVIQKIFDVARKFSIIRFDAAMTLAKKHFARLWYPRPGTGGDIPSRADYAMSKTQFDALFPVEFWREVVDRMNAEMPETLLLAEAFWFMEGYFVRTLGMHRVYNSAFMHMLKNEENEKYRDLITNTLEYEPEILKRYVNFMSNPDEETAIRQFGTGDKYFGICTLMSTLPGLPMFAHGQVEGYTEKYGMEYQRAYYNELPNQWFVEKHERDIFPLTRKRYLFSEVDNFNIFDFTDGYGIVNENVFAYTNRFGDEKALVVFNNKYEQAQGRILFSAPKLTRTHNGKEIISISLAQALNLFPGKKRFIMIREHISGLEYLKTTSEIIENGMYFTLDGFEYRVYWDFREMDDPYGLLDKLYWKLGGNGVSSIDKALVEMRMQPVHEAFEEIFSEDILNFLVKAILNTERSKSEKLGYTLVRGRFENFIMRLQMEGELQDINPSKAANEFISKVKSIESLFNFIHLGETPIRSILANYGISSIDNILTLGSKASYRENMTLLLAYYAIRTLEELKTEKEKTNELTEKYQLQWPLQNILNKTGRGKNAITRDIVLMNILRSYGIQFFDFSHLSWKLTDVSKYDEARKSLLKEKSEVIAKILNDEIVNLFIGSNEYKGVWYFRKENFDELLEWMFTVTVLNYFTEKQTEDQNNYTITREMIVESVKLLINVKELSGKTGFELKSLKQSMGRLSLNFA